MKYLAFLLPLLLTSCGLFDGGTRIEYPVVGITKDGVPQTKISKTVLRFDTSGETDINLTAPGGVYISIKSAGGVNHSEPIRANGEAVASVVKESGTSVTKPITGYFSGKSLLEWVRGDTATKLSKQETSRHATTEGTTRVISNNETAVKLAEIP